MAWALRAPQLHQQAERQCVCVCVPKALLPMPMAGIVVHTRKCKPGGLCV